MKPTLCSALLCSALLAVLLLLGATALVGGVEPASAHEVLFSAEGHGDGKDWSLRFDGEGWDGRWPRERPVIGVLAVFFVLAVFTSVYFLPTILAFGRKMRYRVPLFVVNFFFGWTFIGWVFCLAWSFWPDREASAAR